MDDEFALCWNNFTDNITTGFQNLYDRGDLIDVTLACDGKLLHAHKIVLAICSPYFQEMFLTNPDKHPIIILKDVTFNVMCELLQFMYQGVVNVKQTELSSFMKIAQLLQIKGLTGSGNNNSNHSPKSPSLRIDHDHQPSATGSSSLTPTGATGKSSSSNSHNNNNSINSPDTIVASATNNNNQTESKYSHSSSNQLQSQSHQTQQQLSRMHISENSSSSISSIGAAATATTTINSSNLKRLNDFATDSLSIYSRKQIKRAASELSESEHHHNLNSNDSMDHMNPEDVFLPPIPQITMGSGSGGGGSSNLTGDGAINSAIGNNNAGGNCGGGGGGGSSSSNNPRFDLINVKREISDHHSSRSISPNGSSNVAAIRSQLPHFNFDYNIYAAAAANKNLDYPNDLHIPNDFSKNTANHMDIPAAGSAITMLSTTSLLHGSCIFNRNNTVATQQGMKTYWLCKSYRISMCRARCITHQGRVISSTGVHNHPQHMKNNEIINMSLFQFPQTQQSQQQTSTSQMTQQQQLQQVPGLQQQQTTSQPIILSATSLSTSAATSLNQSTPGLTLGNTNLNSTNLHGPLSIGGSGGGTGTSGGGNGNENNTTLAGNINSGTLGTNSNSTTNLGSSNIRSTQNSNLHVQQLPPNYQNSTSQHLNNLNNLATASNSFNNSPSDIGISNSNSHQLQNQQQQHSSMMQNVLSHQHSLMHLSNLPSSMLNVSNSLHQQQQLQQQQQLSPIHAHQQQPSHHTSLQHLQHQISQLSPSHLSSNSSPTIHSHSHHHHHNSNQNHQHHSHHHHTLGGSSVQITPIIDDSDNNNDNDSSNLNSPQNNRRNDSNSGGGGGIHHQSSHSHTQHIESPSLQQSNNKNQLDSPTETTQQNNDNQLQSSDNHNHHHHQQHHHHHHHQHSTIIVSNELSNNNSNNEESHNHDDNDDEDDDCHNPNSNQSSMLATISISPGPHTTFKMEDM